MEAPNTEPLPRRSDQPPPLPSRPTDPLPRKAEVNYGVSPQYPSLTGTPLASSTTVTASTSLSSSKMQGLQKTNSSNGISRSASLKLRVGAPTKLEAALELFQSYTAEDVDLESIFNKNGGIDLKEILKTMRSDDYKERHHIRVKAMEVLCSDIVPKLSPEAKSFVASSMFPKRIFGKLSEEEQNWFTSIFLVSTGDELTEIKNRIDFHGKYKNFHQLVYKFLEGEQKMKLLGHLDLNQHQWPERHSVRSHKPVKILSDIDDTLRCSGASIGAGCDIRYPAGECYPGVFAFYRELDIGSEGESYDSQQACTNLAFVSARMHTPGGLAEELSYKSLDKLIQTGKLHTEPIILAGDFGSTGILWKNFEPSAKKKVENFVEYSTLYPEYNVVFVGDNGQGDYKAGLEMLASAEHVLEVFIHAVQPIEKTYGLNVDHLKHGNIFFFENYVGAALEAFKYGLISENGLVRVINEAKEDLMTMISRYLPDFPKVSALKKKKEILKDQKLRDQFLARIEELNRDILRSSYLLSDQKKVTEIEIFKK